MVKTMTTEVNTSTLSWLDSSEHERRTVLELVSALNEPGTLDELGIGSIRDTISNELFPGTSTIQTRARYFLFIPWIMQMVERSSTSSPANRARRLQLKLCNALVKSHGTDPGVIGRQAGAALQRWPLGIYWLGMGKWGIRHYWGSISSYFETLHRPSSLNMLGRALEEPVDGRKDEAVEGILGNWAKLPRRPLGFPDEATFTLTAEEGRFLRERVALSNPHSYLAHILQNGQAKQTTSAKFPWNHPAVETAPQSVRAWLDDARLFSVVHQGGVLLYDLMLAELQKDEDRSESFADRLTKWSDAVATSEFELRRWDRAAMWRRLFRVNPRLRTRTREFADRWYDLVSTSANGHIQKRPEARRLISERERMLKGARARLTYPEARDRRRGYPFPGLLNYRWPRVQRICAEILSALEQD